MNKNSCAILQPHYIPWIGYFSMISRVEKFIFLDDVQYIKREWKNRNKIRKHSSSSSAKWLSVPITKSTKDNMIKDVKISYEFDWITEHLNSVQETYKKTKYFDEVFGIFKKILLAKETFLSDLNIKFIKEICKYLNIKSEFILSSELSTQGKKDYKLLNICKKVNSNFLLANNSTLKYLKTDIFSENNIIVEPQNYNHPNYEQFFDKKPVVWISNLSVLDLLFNYGAGSKTVILRG